MHKINYQKASWNILINLEKLKCLFYSGCGLGSAVIAVVYVQQPRRYFGGEALPNSGQRIVLNKVELYLQIKGSFCLGLIRRAERFLTSVCLEEKHHPTRFWDPALSSTRSM